jgi:hypothetical protein
MPKSAMAQRNVIKTSCLVVANVIPQSLDRSKKLMR